MQKLQLVSYIVLIGLVPVGSHAQEAPSQDGFSLGLIATAGVNSYVGEDTTFGGLPLVNYRKGPFSIGLQGLSYDAFQSEQLTFSVGVTPRITGLEDPDSEALEGIDRDFTADAFATVGYPLGNEFGLEATFRQEVTGEHDGQEVQVQLGYATRLGLTGINFAAGGKWQSAELANYTWGVSPDEAILGRPAYDAGDVFIPFFTAGTAIPINQNLAMVGNLSADFLPSDVTDSPIVEDNTAVRISLGAVYKF